MGEARRHTRRFLLLILLVGALCAGSPPVVAQQEHRIGVLAVRPKEKMEAAFAPLADYLGQRLPGKHFSVRAYRRNELREAARRREFDFVIVNPDLYVELEYRHGARRIATLINDEGGRPSSEFSGVIFTRASRADLRTLADLKGKRIAAVAPDAFGGYLIQGVELIDAGLDPSEDIRPLFLGLPQDNVVAAVLEGRADAGFVRSGVLEGMAAEGKLSLAELKPLGAKNGHNPYWHSTRPYPEWPFAAMPQVAADLAKDVAIALLSMPADHFAARRANSFGWDVPVGYEPVHEVLKKMRMPPYDAPVDIDWRDVLRRYDLPIMALLLLIGAAFALLSWRNHLLRRTLEKDQQQLKLAAAVFDNATEGMVITDPGGTILDVNAAFTSVTGYGREEACGQNIRLLKSGRHEPGFYAEMWRALRESGRWRGEIWNRRKDGTAYPELLSIAAVRDAAGRTTHYIGNFIDISELKAAEENLRRLAHFDPLTQLPNRVLLMDRLELALKQTRRRGRLLAVCFLDLDGFKAVNDQWGHALGDRLLIEVAHRLSTAVREGDTAARLGGDEFVLLIVDLTTIDELEQILERILRTIAAPFSLEEREAHIGTSIGVTIYPLDEAGADGLLRHADHAMYRAKQAGRGRYDFFDPMNLAERDG
ncbi:diguanylate cyclase domain-containing protein [Sulfuricystis multivorans]|uniref:diguanylate cyclase domain-containing protein n=1 Tax=Sulfuricystis multivorans TaxID=2211108 RepID=UPI000F84A829|nr:diguanylate cyclase [Sulfuricystis multivorans]